MFADKLPIHALLVTKEDILEHFKAHGTGNITEVKLMNGFGFIEYDDSMDAADVVPGKQYTLPDLSLLCGLGYMLVG